MRCINCGWDNPNNAKCCEKCNTPLINRENEVSINKDNQSFSKTIIGKAPEEPFIDEVKEKNEFQKTLDQTNNCPECGYPLMPGTETCPNCNKDLVKKNNNVVNGTIDPYRTAQNLTKCILTPISRVDEKPLNSIVFTDANNIVNRETIEPTNATISSKCQAELIYKDNKWFIIDRSSANTTFILAKEFTELKNGDTILLGDRKFNVKI